MTVIIPITFVSNILLTILSTESINIVISDSNSSTKNSIESLSKKRDILSVSTQI